MGEPISHAEDREDKPRNRPIGFELSAKIHDVSVNGALKSLGVFAQHPFHELGACECTTGGLHQDDQEPKLGRRQRHLASAKNDLASLEIDHQLTMAQHRSGWRLGTAKDGAHAAHELPRAEGLRDVIVGANIETVHAIVFRGARRQHDNRHPAARLAEGSTDLDAVDRRQRKVQNDEIAPSGRGLVQGLGAVRTYRHIVASVFEITLNRIGRLALILDDENCYSRSPPPLRRVEPLDFWPMARNAQRFDLLCQRL
jgi:hypothetical protein